MLAELHIRNFAIIDELTLRLGPRLNVLTGETGAGKSIIVDAVSLLLGGRAETDVIRSEADFALIEAIFTLDAPVWEQVEPALQALGLEGEPGTLMLAREVRREQRNICRVNGRIVPLREFQTFGEVLIDVHGQGNHLSLLRVKEHIEFLDRYADLLPMRAEVDDLVQELRAVRRELRELQQDERELARRMDLLQYQVAEINAAGLSVGEEEELMEERNRLANAEQIQSLAEEGYAALYEGEDQQQAAIDLLSQVEHAVSKLCRYDTRWEAWLQTVRDAQSQIEDLARELRAYGDEIEYSPPKLATVEGRLNLMYTLKRKYGDSIEAVLAFGAKAARELEAITHSEDRIEELTLRENDLLRAIGDKAHALSEARREAARRLSEGVEGELAALGMERARFEVDIKQEPSDDGAWVGGQRFAFDRTGVDQVEFLVAANLGEPLKPMVRVASGGETSRLLLALKTVLTRADNIPTLIFDEIDVGIGGKIGSIVGHKLWSLAENHQVLCVTHLPQIASYADSHFAVRKEVLGQRTVTRLEQVSGQRRTDEVAAMLGAVTDSTRESADEMIHQVDGLKFAAKTA